MDTRIEMLSRRECIRRIVGASATLGAAANLCDAQLVRRSSMSDRFGLRMLYPTVACGRVWYSTWDNGRCRVLTSGQRDPYDPEFIVRGDDGPPHNVTIDGNGLATISGDSPRLYVYDPKQVRKWQNVEITFYGQRISETGVKSSQGFVAGARSEHQNSNICQCAGQTYYGRMLYDGRINFQREVVYEEYFSTNKPSEKTTYSWPGGQTIPVGLWVGYKFVVRNINDNSNVSLSLYLDLAGGGGGGHWVKIANYVDAGDWVGEPDNDWPPEEVEMRCNESAARVFTAPGTSVFVRNDLVSEANYKQFSIREIDPDPSLYSFENGVQGWSTTYSGIQLLSSNSHAYAGARSLAVVFSGSQALKSQVFVAHPSLRPGEEIKVYVWVPSGSAILSVAPFVEDYYWNWTDGWQPISKLDLDAWNEFTIKVPFSAELPFARLGLEFTSSAPWAGVCYVDSVGYR